jgi:hypothetical protein
MKKILRDWLLTVDVESKGAHALKNARKHTPVHERSYLTSVDYGHVSDGAR